MGSESSSNSTSECDGNVKYRETQVVLNVYDLTPLNNYMSWFGFGIFHSGIEVHGKEYGFGAHDFPASGVFEVEPRTCPDDISWRLTAKHIPGWVNRLARLGALCSCLLPESLQVSTVKQQPEYHDCSEEDGTESLSITTAHESTEIDDDQEKCLLSPMAVSGDVAFVKEVHK
ncbi:hypothetical protein I3760_03G231400 [Carya illinoinensis]|nr:hypothetical protein I3760_03G231400 [Carya illinoinensis]